MRLICPNCGATYEVDASLVPAAGRDVQCSNCGHGWFQYPDGVTPDEQEEVEAPVSDTGTTAAPGPGPRRRELDPEVADVLREEARREAEARRGEKPETLESQPDLGIDDSDERTASRSAAARARMARLRGVDDGEPAPDTRKGNSAELLPDVDEINSTLRGRQERGDVNPTPVSVDEEEPKKRRFGLGFMLVLLICIIAVAVYAFAPRIEEAVPQAGPYLRAYVEWANMVRGQINEIVDSVAQKIRDFSAGVGG